MGWGELHNRTAGSDSERSWTIECHGTRPLTVNKVATMHRQLWARHTRTVRESWWALTLQARVPRLAAVTLEVTPLHRDRRSPQDVAACAPEAKAAIDGIVDAGVIPDDNPHHLHAITFRPPDICGVDGLRITIHPAGPVLASNTTRRAA